MEELRNTLKGAVEGTGEVTESLMSTAADIVKAGTHDIGDIFKAVIDIGKEGAVDVVVGVKSVYVGAVKALKESGKSTEEAVSVVTVKAEKAIGEVAKEGEGEIGGAARKGIEEAKAVVKEPFQG